MLEDFYLLDEDGSPVLNEDGNNIFKARPETKTQADLDRVIGLGKPQYVLDKFAEMVAIGEQWDWFDEYQDHLIEVEKITAYNDNLPVLALGEDGITPVYAQPKELPKEPVRPQVRTGYEVLNPYSRDLFKKDRSARVTNIKVAVDGMEFDGDEESQTRMARAIVALDEGETILWVLADNTASQPTREQLKNALRLAGEVQAEIWVM